MDPGGEPGVDSGLNAAAGGDHEGPGTLPGIDVGMDTPLTMATPAGGVGYYKRGEAIVAYDLDQPSNEAQSTAAAKLQQMTSGDHLLLRPMRQREADIRKYQKLSLIAKRVKHGMRAGEALESEGLEPAARATLPNVRGTVHTASGSSKTNEEHAFRVRHFPGNTDPPEDVLRELSNASTLLAEYVLEQARPSYRGRIPSELLPAKWRDGEKDDALVSANINPKMQKGSAFIKANEAQPSTKAKPRMIQAGSKEQRAIEAMSVKLAEHAFFTCPVFEKRSIKHANLDGVAARMKKFIERFSDGSCISVDFGSWDSTIGIALRSAVENVFLDVFWEGSQFIWASHGKAAKARFAKELKLKSRFFNLTATQFGRRSGDAGTSFLNFVTNVSLFLVLSARIGGRTIPDTFNLWVADLLDMDIVIEGDDNALFLGPSRSTPEAFETIKAYYSALGMNWEPAARKGQVANSFAEGVFAPAERVEFTSKYYVYHRGYVLAVPKFEKVLASASISFSRNKFEDVMSTKAISGMLECAYAPILYEMYAAMLRFSGSKAYVPATWVEHGLQALTEDAGGPIEAAEDRRARSIQHSGRAVHAFLEREYSIPSGRLDTLAQAISTLGADDWQRFGDYLAELKALVAQ